MRLCNDKNRLESKRRRQDCLRHGRFTRGEFAGKSILRADNKALKVYTARANSDDIVWFINKALKVPSDKNVRESLRGLLEKVNLAFCYRS